MTPRRADIDLFVLDAVADDLESLEDIVRMTNSPVRGWQHLFGGPIPRSDLELAVLRVVREDLVEAYALHASGKELVGIGRGVLPTGDLDDYWFRLTERGKMVHSAWEPPLQGEG